MQERQQMLVMIKNGFII